MLNAWSREKKSIYGVTIINIALLENFSYKISYFSGFRWNVIPSKAYAYDGDKIHHRILAHWYRLVATFLTSLATR